MTPRSVEILLALSEAGSVTQAARLLGVSQPAATKALRRAEDEAGFAVFHRERGRLMPTRQAELLMPELQRLQDELRRLDRTVANIGTGRFGMLSIAAIPTLGEVAMPQAVSRFVADRPGVDLTLQVRPRRQVIDLVASQAVDLGVTFFVPSHPNVRAETLSTGELVCIMPPTHPLAVKPALSAVDLLKEPFIRFSPDQGLRSLVDAVFAEVRRAPAHRVEVGLISSAWAMVAAGAGISIVDDLSRMERIYPSLTMRSLRPSVPVAVELLAPGRRPLSVLAQSFVATLKEELAAAAPFP